MKNPPLRVEIYINGVPASAYPPEALAEIKRELTERAFRAAGYVPEGEAERKAK